MVLERDDVDVNSRDCCAASPLFIAAKEGHEAIVKILLERDDVDVLLRDELGLLPLHTAAENRHEAVGKLLVEAHIVRFHLSREEADAISSDRQRHAELSAAIEEMYPAIERSIRDPNV
jgi:ankyrin repeat protein